MYVSGFALMKKLPVVLFLVVSAEPSPKMVWPPMMMYVYTMEKCKGDRRTAIYRLEPIYFGNSHKHAPP